MSSKTAGALTGRATSEVCPPPHTSGPSSRFTFKGNLRKTRYGWLRLTPAYSVELVRELLRQAEGGPVLDPFCGTGTTLLACAEAGIPCSTLDLNPFLIWLAKAKTAHYSEARIGEARSLLHAMIRAARRTSSEGRFVPELYRIERWWNAPTLGALSRAHEAMTKGRTVSTPARDLAKLSFCRTLIEVANVSFGHQSMSFRLRDTGGPPAVAEHLDAAFEEIAAAAKGRLAGSRGAALVGDARRVDALFPPRQFRTVITSPPYPNRMSYIRELRPYMYWLGYLSDRREAGLLDWQAIGGTWGVATSNLGRWSADPKRRIPFAGFETLVRRITRESAPLGRYVHKYFEDMVVHVLALSRTVARGGEVHYVVGNSKFFDVVVPVPEIFASIFETAGFRHAEVVRLRKRTSKKELYEYRVSARKG